MWAGSAEACASLPPPRIHVGVPVTESGIALLVAAATLHVFEVHDAVLMAEEDGDEFDPHTDALERIFGSYGLVRREDDARHPWWLCGTPNPNFSERDVARAIRRMGHFGHRVQPIYSCGSSLLTTRTLHTTDVAMHADELGVSLPSDASMRLRALIGKHSPRPERHLGVKGEMRRLERAAEVLALAYNSSSESARCAGGGGSPLGRQRTLRV
jgi:hypothetical protein